jgi:hypothetical protein
MLIAACGSKHPAMAKRLMETWRMLVERNNVSKWDVCCGLGSVAGSSLSIPQAKVLVEGEKASARSSYTEGAVEML